MSQSKEELINDITTHFKGQAYENCYVGITADAESRLFGDHNVSKEEGFWIYRTASSHSVARDVERYFLDAGMDGGGGGGSDDSRIVYAYKKTPYTRP